MPKAKASGNTKRVVTPSQNGPGAKVGKQTAASKKDEGAEDNSYDESFGLGSPNPDNKGSSSKRKSGAFYETVSMRLCVETFGNLISDEVSLGPTGKLHDDDAMAFFIRQYVAGIAPKKAKMAPQESIPVEIGSTPTSSRAQTL